MAVGAPRARHPNKPRPRAPWGDTAPPAILPTARWSARAWALRPRGERHAQGASGTGVPEARVAPAPLSPMAPGPRANAAARPPWPPCGWALWSMRDRPILRGLAARGVARARPMGLAARLSAAQRLWGRPIFNLVYHQHNCGHCVIKPADHDFINGLSVINAFVRHKFQRSNFSQRSKWRI